MEDLFKAMESFIDSNPQEGVRHILRNGAFVVSNDNGESATVNVVEALFGKFDVEISTELHHTSEFGILICNLQTFIYMTGVTNKIVFTTRVGALMPTAYFS